jgi:hypothetical protein
MALRWIVAIAAGSVLALCCTGVAQADDYSQDSNSNNGDNRVTVVEMGQVDDPAEDVLEHFGHIGSMSEGPEAAEPAEAPEPLEPGEAPEPGETAAPAEAPESGAAVEGATVPAPVSG